MRDFKRCLLQVWSFCTVQNLSLKVQTEGNM